MSERKTVRRYLDEQDIRYVNIALPVAAEEMFQRGSKDIRPQKIAKSVMLKDLRGMLMAIVPGPHKIDIASLNQVLHRNLQLASAEDYRGVFRDCAADLIPPLGECYGIETIIDDALVDLDLVYFTSGKPNELIRISGQDFQLLHSNAWFGNSFSHITANTVAPSKTGHSMTHELLHAKLKRDIQGLTRLPAMPGMAQEILQLNQNPNAHANDLAQLIEHDPSLAAQVIRYAQSPFYGYSGQIQSVRQAISRVLGYDLVMNIALGVLVTRPFQIPHTGPMGLHAFWRHAVYAGALTQGLCNLVPRKIRPRPGTAYLCGLLQNIGLLILGYLQPEILAELNQTVAATPYKPRLLLEREVLGVDHCEIGYWLMTAWDMPADLTDCVRHHHAASSQDRRRIYSNLVYIANILLKAHDIGDAEVNALPEELLHSLGLEEAQVLAMLERTLQGRRELELVAKQLAA